MCYLNFQGLVTPEDEYYVVGDTAYGWDEAGRLRTWIVKGVASRLERLEMAPVGVVGEVYGDIGSGGGGGLGCEQSILHLRVL